MKNYAIKAEHLTLGYDVGHEILSDTFIEIPQGHLCALVGPNGAGKTTLLKSFVGLLKPRSGTIELCGNFAYVAQYAHVDWTFPLSVCDVVLMGSYQKLGLFKRPQAHEYERAMQALCVVGMGNYADAWIGKLSGGQRQRVLIARALMQDATIVFLDEPFSAVDKKTEEALIEVFFALVKKGKTIVMVHHDILTVKKVSDWVILVNRSIVAQGKTLDVLTHENIEKTYGGYVL